MSVLPEDAAPAFPWTEADAMYLLLVRYAADLRNCEPGSEQEEEFDRVSHTPQAYEGKLIAVQRASPCLPWPSRKTDDV